MKSHTNDINRYWPGTMYMYTVLNIFKFIILHCL